MTINKKAKSLGFVRIATLAIAAVTVLGLGYAAVAFAAMNLDYHNNAGCTGSGVSTLVSNTAACVKGTGLGTDHDHHLAVFAPSNSVTAFAVSATANAGNQEASFTPNECGTWTTKVINDTDQSEEGSLTIEVTGCTPPPPALGSITINKVVAGVGASTALDFAFGVTGTSTGSLSISQDDAPVVISNLLAGNFTITETDGGADWELTSISCDDGSVGNLGTGAVTVNLAADEDVICDFTNTYTAPVNPPTSGGLIVTKTVEGGTAVVSDFVLSVGNGSATSTVASGAETSFAGGTYTVTETASSSYTATFGGACNSAGQVTVTNGATSTCTILNTFVPPTQGTLTVTKIVDNGDGSGTSVVSDFVLSVGNGVSTSTVTSGISVPLDPGTYQVVESGPGGYSLSYGSDCINGFVTVAAGQGATCTLTNDDIPRTGDDDDTLSCTLTVSDDEADEGDEVTLTWTSDNATSASIDQGIGGVGLNGSTDVEFEDDITYTLTVSNSQTEETETCQVSIDEESGGGGGGSRRTSGDDDDSSDEGEVLGAQTSTIPAGVPNTGAGGMAAEGANAFGMILSLFGGLALFAGKKKF